MYLLFNDCKDIGSLLYSSGSFDESENAFERTIRKAYEIVEKSVLQYDNNILKEMTHEVNLFSKDKVSKVYKLVIKGKAFFAENSYDLVVNNGIDESVTLYILEV